MKEKMKITYMRMAKILAERSSAKRLKVGALLIKDNRIISDGYNGTPKGWDNKCENFGVTSSNVIHAEANCLAKMCQSHEVTTGCEIVVTVSPCIDCAKLIYNAGIIKVYYETRFRAEEGITFLLKNNIAVEQIITENTEIK